MRSLNPSDNAIRQKEISDAYLLLKKNNIIDGKEILNHEDACKKKFKCGITEHVAKPVDKLDYYLKFAKYKNNKKVK
jgi:hypothetical protein